MIDQIYTYFTIETLYMWINLGVLPFWFILIVFPQSHLSRIFVTSIFPFLILGGVYIFILYKSYLTSYDFDGNFTLYLGLYELSKLFEDPLLMRKILWLKATRNSYTAIGKYLIYHRTTIKRMYDNVLDKLTNKIIKESLDIFDKKFSY